MGRPSGRKMKQKDYNGPEPDILLHPSSEGIGKKTSDSEFEDFQEREIKRSFKVYHLNGEPARIVFDYKTRTLCIEVGEIFSLSQSNHDPKIMRELEQQLEKFPVEERECILAKKGDIKRKRKKKF